MWGQWWLVTLALYACTVFTTATLKHAGDKGMITTVTLFSNLVMGWPLVAPFALSQGLGPIRSHWRHVLAIALLVGLRKNLANTSLYSIGVSLKTALHSFNVLFTVLLVALLGVDRASYWCLFRCHCGGKFMLALGLAFVAIGGIATAAFDQGSIWKWDGGVGIVLQLASTFIDALKYVTMKMLLGDESRREMFLLSSDKPPSPVQVAFVANPVSGLVSLLFYPFLEESLGVPHGLWRMAAANAVSITGILLLQLRLTQLTTPLTVAVIAVTRDICTVAFFLYFTEESFSREQACGYCVSALGVFIYACSLRGQHTLVREDTNSSIGSAVERASYVSESSAMSAGGTLR